MSHTCGCSANEMYKVDKVRRKGVSNEPLPNAFTIECSCKESFTMTTHEAKCPNCQMVYAVTPCSNDAVENVEAAGINY